MKKNTIFLCILICFLLCGCTNNSLYSTPDSSYYTMDCMTSVAFSIPERFYTMATAINRISDEAEYERNVLYSYKNGTDEYIMFSMNEFVVACSKTSFGFSASEDKINTLQSAPLFNIWFHPASKKNNYNELTKGTAYKIIHNVQAEVAITTNLFDDFVGKLATISNTETGEEWSLFAGVPGVDFKDIDDKRINVIDDITKSLTFSTHSTVEEEPSYEVVISGFEEKQADASIVEETGTDIEIISEESTEDIASSEMTRSEAESIASIHEFEKIEVGGTQSLEKEISKAGLNRNNQKEKVKEIGTAYSSDIYSMLEIGDTGLMKLWESPDIPIPIRLNKVYTGDEAIRLIKQSLKGAPYEYFDAPDGYSWEAVTYDVSYAGFDKLPYINIKLIGLDGTNLKFRGISNSTMTHDANYQATCDADKTYGMVCYYAVPNGCKEYALECGNLIREENTCQAAYFHISR